MDSSLRLRVVNSDIDTNREYSQNEGEVVEEELEEGEDSLELQSGTGVVAGSFTIYPCWPIPVHCVVNIADDKVNLYPQGSIRVISDPLGKLLNYALDKVANHVHCKISLSQDQPPPPSDGPPPKMRFSRDRATGSLLMCGQKVTFMDTEVLWFDSRDQNFSRLWIIILLSISFTFVSFEYIWSLMNPFLNAMYDG